MEHIKSHTGVVTEYMRTDWGAKGRVQTGACEIPFIVPIAKSYMADQIDVGCVIDYGKDPSGAVHLPIIHALVPPVSESVPYLNEDEVKPYRAIKEVVELHLSGMTAMQAQVRELLEKLPDV